jgi:hypothetical protein
MENNGKIYKRRNYDMLSACADLYPEMNWYMEDGDYSTFEWNHHATPKPTKTELEEHAAALNAAEPLRVIRLERDKRLAASDWVVTKALETGEAVPANWATYRQALRDITTAEYTIQDSDGEILIEWPTKPE